MSFNDDDQIYQQELMGKIYDEYQQMCQQNQEESIKQCEAVLREVFDTLEKGVFDGSYLRSGGYRQYRDMLRHLTSDYRARTHSQIMSEEVLSKFLKEKEDIGNMILQADQSLSEVEQEKEVQRLKNEILEQRQRGLEEQNQLQERAFKDMQRTHKEHVDQILQQMETEKERMRRDNERVLKAKLREKDALVQKGLQEQASQMQRQIDHLRSEMHKEEKSKPSTVSRIMDGISATAELILPGFVSRGLSAVSKWFK